MDAAVQTLRLARHGRDPRARAALVALMLRSRPPAAATSIEARRTELERSTEPLGSDGRTVGEHTARTSKARRPAAFLHRLVKAVEPQRVVEMGASVGLSGSYIASALPPGGRLVTLDIVPKAVATARQTFRVLGLADRVEVVEGSFADTLAPTLRSEAPVDFLFVDGHHEQEATLHYFEPAASPCPSARSASSPSSRSRRSAGQAAPAEDARRRPGVAPLRSVLRTHGSPHVRFRTRRPAAFTVHPGAISGFRTLRLATSVHTVNKDLGEDVP